MTEPQLVDAQTMHLHNPDSFWVPTQEEVEQAIEARRCVKVAPPRAYTCVWTG